MERLLVVLSKRLFFFLDSPILELYPKNKIRHYWFIIQKVIVTLCNFRSFTKTIGFRHERSSRLGKSRGDENYVLKELLRRPDFGHIFKTVNFLESPPLPHHVL